MADISSIIWQQWNLSLSLSDQAKHLQCCLATYRNESYYTFPQHVMALNYWRIISPVSAISEPDFTNMSYIIWVKKNGYSIFTPTFSQQMIIEFSIVPFSKVWNSSRFYFILLLILNKNTSQYFRQDARLYKDIT
jgi:hypothetical protein